MKALKISLRIIGMILLLIGFDFVVQHYPNSLWYFSAGWLAVLISFFIKTSE